MRIFTCNTCARIHLEIGNTQIHFDSLRDLEKYSDFLASIDTGYYAAINRKKGMEKVIVLSLADNGKAHIGFTEQEFETLKKTIRTYINKDVKYKRSKPNIKAKDIPIFMFN